jgi:hypothetical protein
MALNESLSFASAPDDVKKAFLDVPDKVYLRPGTKLYKWTEYSLEGGDVVTPWWSYVIQTTLPSGRVAEGFRTSEERALRLGVTHREYQRVREAVSEKFNNSMENLLVIELKSDVWGLAGPSAGQPKFKAPQLANVYFIGGKCQLWIPNLTTADVHQIPAL